MDDTWWRSQDQLDPDQAALVDIPIGGSHLVVGPPGSGKTNILLLRAAYITRAGQGNIIILSFTRLLREFMATGSTHYPFESERVQTFRTWGADLIRNSGGEVDTKGDFPSVRRRIVEGLKALRDAGTEEMQYDCILIDEAQDYTAEEIEVIRHFAGDVFAVGDEHQRIYQAQGALDYLETFCKKAPPLRFHFRNGIKICRLADGIMGDPKNSMVTNCNYDEGRYPSTVQRFGGLSNQDQVTKALPELQTQLLAYPDEWIGVLAPTNDDVSEIYGYLSQTAIADKVQVQQYDVGYEALDHARPIIVGTIHGAKGLEYRTVHLMALDRISKIQKNRQKLAYTAVTRTKTSLTIYHNGAIPGYIERGLLAVDGAPVQKPKLSELFK